MNNKTEATMKGVKDLSGELSAWEVRLLALQNESETLRRKNDQVKKEIESALAIAQAELDKKREAARQEAAKISEANSQLEAKKEEFQGILVTFNKEKREFEAERTRVIDRDADTQKLKERLTNFMYLIKQESQKI